MHGTRLVDGLATGWPPLFLFLIILPCETPAIEANTMRNTSEIKELVIGWMQGMSFTSFSHAAGFILQFEHSGFETDRPKVLCLEIKARCYVGSIEDWNRITEQLPFRARPIDPDEPALAYWLMLLMGSTIDHVRINEDGALSMFTSDSEVLTVEGTDDIWDESWILRQPPDLGRLKIICDSQGSLTIE